jgi:hypothetical protein
MYAPRKFCLGLLDQMWEVRKDTRAKEDEFLVHVRGFQWEQSCMYTDCRKVNHVCMQIVVGTVAYVRRLQ